jgi:hypothetical protein
MAHVLAGLLDCVGLPQGRSDKRIRKSFELFWQNQLDDLEVREKLKYQNNGENSSAAVCLSQLN